MRLLGFFLLFSVAFHASGQSIDDLMRSGESKLKTRNYEEAIKDFNALLSKDSTFINAYIKRAFAYSMINNYEAVVKDYTKVLSSIPNEYNIMQSRGSALNKLGHYDEALRDFNTIIENDPKNAEAFQNRGWTKKFMGDMKGACEDWHKSKKLGNEEAKIILGNNKCR